MTFPAPRRFLRAAFAAALGWLAAALPATAQEVTLRLHQFLPAQANVPTNLLHPWADRVEAASNGRIKIERYPAMQLGGTPPQLIDQARDGTVDIVWTLPGYTPGRFPTTEVFELPFVMTNAKAASQAYWDMFEKHMKDGEFADVHMIATWVHGPGVIHSRQPVEKLEDLKGMKLRAPSRIVNTLLGHLGATPVGMPVPAVTEALSRGVIDGAVVPWEVAPSVKIEELVSHHTEFAEGQALYTATFVLAMNKARYEALPDDLKKVIDDNSGRELSALFGWTQEHYDGPARQLAVDRGNTILRLDADATARWKDAAQPVIDGWIEEMNGRGLDGAALVEEARALIAKYTEAQ
ncbi:MAG TPA: TRAP transporter substrate-binding protein [Aquamicrobium sp.]|nr:TRAP transporter substrate-binding protein [Aquamicrobium sp.]